MEVTEIMALYEKVSKRKGIGIKEPRKVDNDKPLKCFHGLSRNEYNDMRALQAGVCFICKKIPSRLVLDHNHETGKVRKFLCDSCNFKVGLLESGILRFLSFDQLIDYLG